MASTREGGIKAAATNKLRYGEDFYKKIGATGGATSRGGGFASDSEMARLAGRLGGLKKRKGKSIDEQIKFEIKEAKKDIKYHKSIKKYSN